MRPIDLRRRTGSCAGLSRLGLCIGLWIATAALFLAILLGVLFVHTVEGTRLHGFARDKEVLRNHKAGEFVRRDLPEKARDIAYVIEKWRDLSLSMEFRLSEDDFLEWVKAEDWELEKIRRATVVTLHVAEQPWVGETSHAIVEIENAWCWEQTRKDENDNWPETIEGTYDRGTGIVYYEHDFLVEPY